MIKKIIVLLLIFIGSFSLGFSQTDSTSTPVLKRVVKHNGVEYIGVVLNDDGRELLIETKDLGKIYIPKSEIALIEEFKEKEVLKPGEYRTAGPFTTRYYFTNNALPIKKGDDYAMLHLYGPEVHFSVANNLSVGVMASWIASPIGIAAKYSIPTPNEKVNLSLGTIMFSSGYLYQAKGWGGLHWGSVTFGKPGKNVTLSSGFGYVDLRFNRRSRFETGLERMNRGSVSSVGGIFPVGKKASFLFDCLVAISEQRNYSSYNGDWNPAIGEYEYNLVTYNSGTQVAAVLMPGMRFQTKPDRAFQVALAGVIYYSSIGFGSNSTSSDMISFPVPMCSWFFKF